MMKSMLLTLSIGIKGLFLVSLLLIPVFMFYFNHTSCSDSFCKESSDLKFKTGHNVCVLYSQKTDFLTPTIMEKWTEDLINFWFNAGFRQEDIRDAISRITVNIYDEKVLQYEIPYNSRRVNGLANPVTRDIYISAIPGDKDKQTIYERVWSLYRHEMSHFILGEIDRIWDEKLAHKIFSDYGLGA